ncbi:MAG TPA: hypothetical protein PLP19_19790 [bacterium]|nr:hypothetical protein [bacterium]HPN45737.1 hypothetical protein [bacterium]
MPFAFFCRQGEIFIHERIITLPIGHPKLAAQKIQKSPGTKLFKIKSVKTYPIDYADATRVVSTELYENVIPILSEPAQYMADYPVILHGYLYWRDDILMPLFPFYTRYGSEIVGNECDINKCCPKATVVPGLVIHGIGETILIQMRQADCINVVYCYN